MDRERFSWYVVGLLELDGSFALPRLPSGRRVPRLQLFLKEDEVDLLRRIQDFLGVGSVSMYQPGRGSHGRKPRAHLRIDGPSVVDVLIPFLDEHPFQGPKRQVYEKWRKVVFLLKDGAQETEAGRRLIENLAVEVNQRG